jgi:hypothetical protein
VSTCQLLNWAQADVDMFDVKYLLCRWSAKPWPKSGFVGELGVSIDELLHSERAALRMTTTMH